MTFNLDEAILAVDELMMSAVESDVEVLQDASRHIISAGGKRVRPRVLFLAHQAMGGDRVDDAVRIAAAIELVHTATLVHDDINDHGTLRRGRVTINQRWGRTFALLTGDFLFTVVYQMMAPYKDLNITFSQATTALVEGETLQAAAAKAGDLNRETYQRIVAKKTASLFRAAALLGAELADADQAHIDALGEYGFYLGLAFQVVDDLLDLTGDPRLMGKAAGVDMAQGRGVAAAVGGNGHAAVGAVAVAEETDDDPLFAVKQRLVESGAVEEGRKMAAVLAGQANAALDKLPPSEAVDGLRELINLVVDRDH
ncbi:MAG: polyprenyl synthetase family protein [Chloroflexi bacterium]|nr:polyprenyl synthetase family protein [Chloroflexota bacterium]